MTEQSGLSALRERIGRTEVEVTHQAEKLKEHDRRLEHGSKRMAAITDRLGSIERRLESIERLLRVMHQVTRWGLASVGTMMLEAMTGTLRSIIKFVTGAGSGS